MPTFTPAEQFEFERRFRNAQRDRLPWNDVCGPALRQVISAEAQASACPGEFLLMPLLTVSASMMGTQASLKVNTSWIEPAILWTAVLAQKGENKSGAMKKITSGVNRLQKEITALWEEGPHDDDDPEPKLRVTSFSFERLHEIMLHNNHEILAAYDELEMVFNMLARGNDQDRRQLLSLENGTEWTRDYKCASGIMDKTCFNLTGFVQPYYIMSRYALDNHDGLMDRMQVCCPPEVITFWEGLRPDKPSYLPPLDLVLEIIRKAHPREGPHHEYTLTKTAGALFGKHFNKLILQKMDIKFDLDRRSLLSKSRGKAARSSLILCAINQATSMAMAITMSSQGQSTNTVQAEWDSYLQGPDAELNDSYESTSTSASGELNPSQLNDASQLASSSTGVMKQLQKYEGVTTVEEAVSRWKYQVQDEDVKQACALGIYLLAQQFHLLPPEMEPALALVLPETTPHVVMSTHPLLSAKNGQRLSALLRHGPEVKASDVSRKRLMPPIVDDNGKKYTVALAQRWLRDVSGHGFGLVETVRQQKGHREYSHLVFRRTQMQDLSDECQQLLSRLDCEYSDPIGTPASSSASISSV